MKLSARLKIVIPVMLLTGVILFAVWYFTTWFIPTGTIVSGAPIELMKLVQNDKKVKVFIKKNDGVKEVTLLLPDGKPLLYQFKYKEKIFLEQTILVNGTPMKGIYRNDHGFDLGYTVTFIPGEKREYVLRFQIDWQVERHRLLNRLRGKVWKTNTSIR